MFTVDRSSLRNSTKRRDYVFSTDHQKSYLTPSSNSNPGAAATTIDADANPDANPDANTLVDNLNFDIDDDLCDTSDIDSNNPTTQSQDLSVDPFDSASQTLPLLRPTPTVLARSWAFDHFTEIVLEGQVYIPRGTSAQKKDRRRCCKHCSWFVLDSKRHGTSNLITHLSKHGITKNRVPKHTTSIADLLTKSTVTQKPSISPEQSIVN